MEFSEFYKSVYAIMRIDTALQQNNARIEGTAFLIRANPITLLTCHHVVSEGSAQNDGQIIYHVAKRSNLVGDIDLRNAQISTTKIVSIRHSPDRDLAILEVDPAITGLDQLRLLGLDDPRPLALSFNAGHREIGGNIEWLSPAMAGDLTLTPRFSKAHITTLFISNHSYRYRNAQQQDITHVMPGVGILETDKLFIPGASGSPILHSETGRVIAHVHGFNPIQIHQGPPPVVATVSFGIDLRSSQDYLRQQGLVA